MPDESPDMLFYAPLGDDMDIHPCAPMVHIDYIAAIDKFEFIITDKTAPLYFIDTTQYTTAQVRERVAALLYLGFEPSCYVADQGLCQFHSDTYAAGSTSYCARVPLAPLKLGRKMQSALKDVSNATTEHYTIDTLLKDAPTYIGLMNIYRKHRKNRWPHLLDTDTRLDYRINEWQARGVPSEFIIYRLADGDILGATAYIDCGDVVYAEQSFFNVDMMALFPKPGLSALSLFFKRMEMMGKTYAYVGFMSIPEPGVANPDTSTRYKALFKPEILHPDGKWRRYKGRSCPSQAEMKTLLMRQEKIEILATPDRNFEHRMPVEKYPALKILR